MLVSFNLGEHLNIVLHYPPGPISKLEDAKYVFQSTHDVHGFYGSVETTIAGSVKLYKGMTPLRFR